MSYLAVVMANRPEAAAEPVTDYEAALGALADVGQVATEEGSDRGQATGSGDLRMHVLEALLPSPGVPIEPAALAEFKRDNPRLLSSFRAAIDDAVSRTAGYRGETQQLALDVEIRGLRDQLDGIMEQLRVLEWKPVLTTLAALAVGPGAELLAGEVGLAFAGGAAVYAGALELAWAKRDKRVAMRHPLAYAALAQRGFAANGP